MDLKKYIQDNRLEIHVIPSSGREEIKDYNGTLKLYLKAVPDKNKANLELIRFIKKEFSLDVRILRGEKSRNKLLEIIS